MNNSRSGILAIIILLFLISFSCGCIHIDLGKPFRPEEKTPPEYHIIQKEDFPMSHEFDLSVQYEIKHTDAKPINVKEDTIWINISINVVINDFNFINNSPIQNYSLLERYVLVTIEDQDKEEYFQKKFIETAEAHRQLLSPQKGLWAVKVEAVGLGYQDVKDSYTIDVIANEPV